MRARPSCAPRAETAQEEEATGARIDLARFLLELKGPEAALAELPAEEGGDPVLRALRAQILFNEGSTDEAIAEMESLLEGAEGGIESDENRVVLARMLEATGNRVGAQRLVAQVLEGDSTQIEALKMEAGWANRRGRSRRGDRAPAHRARRIARRRPGP